MKSNITPTAIAIIEDHVGFGEMIGRTLCSASELRSFIVIPTCAEARRHLPKISPSLVVIDNRLEDGRGIDLLGELRVHLPAARWLLYSGYASAQTLRLAISRGIDGAVAKRSPLQVLHDAVSAILGGQRFFCEIVSKELRDFENSPAVTLNETDRRIVALVGSGYEAKEIAALIGLAHKTVLNSLVSIRQKTGAQTMVQIAEFAKANEINR